jgi:hypothetical protein
MVFGQRVHGHHTMAQVKSDQKSGGANRPALETAGSRAVAPRLNTVYINTVTDGPPSLARNSLQRQNHIWRGGALPPVRQCRQPAPTALCRALDAELPGGGMASRRAGRGRCDPVRRVWENFRLSVPALAASYRGLCASVIAWTGNLPICPRAPALRAAGVRLEGLDRGAGHLIPAGGTRL